MAKRLTGAGMSVAIIERHLFGGTCVNTGCIPTKAMVASAYAAHMARARRRLRRRSSTAECRVDMKRVKARKDAISQRSRTGVEKMLRGLERCDRLQRATRGSASAHEVEVGEAVLSSRSHLHQRRRPRLGAADARRRHGSVPDEQLDDGPRRSCRHICIVVGGSYVGLEFGQMFRRFGSEVTIIEMGPRLVQREDEDVSAAIQDILAERRHQPSPERALHSASASSKGQVTARC